MRLAQTALFALALAFVASPATAQEKPWLTRLDQVEELPSETTSVRVRIDGPDLVAALVRRTPGLTTLSISNPSNQIDLRTLEMLAHFKKLRSLTLVGDPFLYDKEFAALGALTQLETLRLSLP